MLPKEPFQRRLLFLFCFGLLVRLILAWLPEKYLFYLVYDDAYYYFTIARNFVTRGMLSADGITLTNGFHPLWLFAITPIYFFFHDYHWLSIHLVLTLSAFFDTAAAFFIYKTLKRLGREKIGFWAAAFYLVNSYVLKYTMSGLETGLNSFLLALLVYSSQKATPEWLKTGWLYLGTICGLALLSRTDNVFAVAVLLGYLVWRDPNFLAITKTATIAFLFVFPWFAYNYSTFGTIVQTSGTTLPWLFHQQYLDQYHSYLSSAFIPYALKSGFYNFSFNAYHYGNWILTLIVAGVLFYRLKGWPESYRPLLWTLVGAGFFVTVHLFIRWSVRPWYPQSAFVLTLPVVALVLEKINKYLIGMGAVLVLYFSSLPAWSPSFCRRIDRLRDMRAIIEEKIPADQRVGAFNSGYLQYFTDRRVINLDGFVNNEVLEYYKKEKGLEYFREKNIRWLVDYTPFLCGTFGPHFGPGAESSLAIVGEIRDSLQPKNDVLAVVVLPPGLVAPTGKRMPIWRQWVARKRWGPIPLPSFKRR